VLVQATSQMMGTFSVKRCTFFCSVLLMLLVGQQEGRLVCKNLWKSQHIASSLSWSNFEGIGWLDKRPKAAAAVIAVG